MQRPAKILITAALVAGTAAAGTGIATAGGSADDAAQVSITGAALSRASAAALAHTGGGRVTETEVGDEESLYEVEVTLDSGGQVDVQLDKDFTVVATKADRDTAGDNG